MAFSVPAPNAVWVQYNATGTLEVRAATDGGQCPYLSLDGQDIEMQRRVGADNNFPQICTSPVSQSAKQAVVAFRADRSDGRPIPIPPSRPTRIVVLGDGGCRIKGGIVQNCQDRDAWPFAASVSAAAALKPDLVIHVGDYPSREQACPKDHPECQGAPFGDNWPVWQADFFTPAAPLLQTSAFVFVRGNHEDCHRTGAGFMRLLAPGAYSAGVCPAHIAPYRVALDGLDLTVFDDSAASETDLDAGLVEDLRQDFETLKAARAPTWLIVHRPIFGAISGPLGVPVGGNVNLIAALPKDGIAPSVRLMLSGHIHAFEAMNYGPEDHIPPQVVAGLGGDVQAPVPAILKGTIFQGGSGVRVADGVGQNLFGFLLLTRGGSADDWRIDVYDHMGQIVQVCRLEGGRIDCPNRK